MFLFRQLASSGIAIYLVALALSGSVSAADLPNSCKASSEIEFQNCLISVKSGQFSHVKISSAFSCENCEFILRGFRPTKKVVIYGNGSRPEHNGSGITRTGACPTTKSKPRGALLWLTQVSNVEVRDLWLKNSGAGQCANAGLLHITFSKDVLVRRIWTTASMFAGIGIIKSDRVRIDKSGFVASRRFGIWLPSSALVASNTITITDNYIAHSTQAGATLSGNDIWFNNNYITRNHSNVGWESEPQGGQIVVHPNSSAIVIDNNRITHGIIRPIGGKSAHGIEVGGFAIDNLIIEYNHISDNEGFAIAFQTSYTLSNVIIRNNEFKNNKLDHCIWGVRDYTDVAFQCDEFEPVMYNNFRTGYRVN